MGISIDLGNNLDIVTQYLLNKNFTVLQYPFASEDKA